MKKRNIFAIIIIFIICTILFANVSYIEAMSEGGWTDFEQAKEKKEEEERKKKDVTTWNFSMDQNIPEELTSTTGTIIAMLRNISALITVVVITILGIKYMIGSVEQKADYKKDYINIIIGTVLITMVFSIVSFIFTVAENI